MTDRDEPVAAPPPPPNGSKQQQQDQLPVIQALRDPAVHRLYANGFTIGMTNADMHVVLQLFGRLVAVVNLSYTLAKTLSIKLAGVVAEWEKRTGRELATTDAIDEAFK